MSVEEPPRALTWGAGAIVAAGVLVVLVGGWRTGVSWDESYHVMRMRNYLEHGWYLLDTDLRGSEPGPWEHQRYVYGPVTMVLLHGWTQLWGVDGAGGVPATAQGYAVRHLGVGLIALVGVAATAAIGRLLLGRRSWGLVAAAVLVCIPVWTGHAMFNVKDVPVATGFTLVTLGLALLLVGARGAVPWALAATAGGVVLAVGTRPGIWPGLALSIGAAGLVLVARRDWRRAGLGIGTVLAAYAVLLAVYPAAFGTPVDLLLGSALESSRFDGKQGHWWYLPLFVLVEMPTGLLVLGLVATAVLATVAVRRLRRGAPEPTDVVVGLVPVQAYALPVLAIVRQANVYTGTRQLLFVAPAMAVLVTAGIALACERSRRSSRSRPWARRAVPVVVGVAMAAPLVAQVQLFPYGYAYSTAVANLAAPLVLDRTGQEVPTDYWRTSVRELAPAVPAAGWVTCSPYADHTGRYVRFSRETHDDCGTALISPLSAYAAARAAPGGADPTRLTVVTTSTERLAPGCRTVAEVRRRIYWRSVRMSAVASCDLHLVAYPADGLDFAEHRRGTFNLVGGWGFRPDLPGAALEESRGWIGFTVPATPQRALVLRGTGTGARAGLRMRVNGVPVRTRLSTADGVDRFRAVVPRAVAAAYGGGRVLVGMEGPESGGFRLLTMKAGGWS